MTDEVKAKLSEYRDSIDNIDAALIYLLSERFKVTEKVGLFKKKYDLPPADPDREQRQITRLRDLAKSAKLDPDFSEQFINFVIEEVIRNHKKIRKS
ncbi:chorismate mutase [Kiloniella laminariae]|uniref:chorismate mutase n=1 Tax=Kiloniella laminariae TaxID=454162 RepID=UPI00036464D3|nr:chorismate mutase [Kiloniella laminariae]